MNAGQTPDLYAMFKETVSKMRAAEMCQITQDIGYATTDAIRDAAVNIPPMDIENVLHRLGCVRSLTDAIYSLCCDEEGAEEIIRQMDALLAGAADGLRMLHQVDMEATCLNYYLPRLRVAN